MLVCSVSLLRRRAAIAADLAEVTTAVDSPGTGNVVFAALVDDPASVGDRLDAFLGQIMLEAASASSTVTAGLSYTATIVEGAIAADLLSSSVPVAGTVAETVAAADAASATVTAAPTIITWDPTTVTNVTLSGGNLVASNTGGSSTDQGARVASSFGKTTGKYYYEITLTASTGGGNTGTGIGTTSSTYINMGNNATVGDEIFSTSGNIFANGSSTGSTLGTLVIGTVVGIAVDLDNRKIWFRKAPSGNWNGSGTANPATNTGGITIPAGTMVPFSTFNASGNVHTANFGASTFTGAVPSGFTSGWASGSGGGGGTTTFDGASSNVTLSNGNLTATHPNTSAAGCASTDFRTDGKFYFEVTSSVSVSSGNSLGVMSPGDGVTAAPSAGGSLKVAVLMGSSSSPVYYPTATNSGKDLGAASVGDVWAAAIDIHNGLAWFRKNGGNWNADASANPATGTGGVAFSARATYAPYVSFAGGAGSTDVMTANFGQFGYSGTPPSGFGNWAPGI